MKIKNNHFKSFHSFLFLFLMYIKKIINSRKKIFILIFNKENYINK